MPSPAFSPRCLRLFAQLRDGQYDRARAEVIELLAARSPEWLYVRVLSPAVFLAGDMAIRGELDMPTTERVVDDVKRLMDMARCKLDRRPRLGRTLFATYMPGDIEGIGFRVIRDWLDRDGWDVVTPTFPIPSEHDLVRKIIESAAAVLAISCSLPRHVVPARRVIRGVRRAGFTGSVWIGGTPLNVMPTLFPKTGADQTAPDVIEFTRNLARQLGYETATPAKLL